MSPIQIKVLNKKFDVSFQRIFASFNPKSYSQSATVCLLRTKSPLRFYTGTALMKHGEVETDLGRRIAFKRAVRAWALENFPVLCDGEYPNLESLFRRALYEAELKSTDVPIVTQSIQLKEADLQEKDWHDQMISERPI